MDNGIQALGWLILWVNMTELQGAQTWSNLILGMSVRVILNELNI